MGHLICAPIKVKHLAVYKVDSGHFYLYFAQFSMIHDAALLVCYIPVGNAVQYWKSKIGNNLLTTPSIKYLWVMSQWISAVTLTHKMKAKISESA